MGKLLFAPFVVTVLLFLLLDGCAALIDPCREGLFVYDEQTQVVQADSLEITADAKWLILHVPDNYRLHRGRWIVAMPEFTGVDTLTIKAERVIQWDVLK